MTQAKSLRSLLVAQFLGAFNDNAWKLMVILLGTRGLMIDLGPDELEAEEQRRAMLAFLVFTLPLVLFSLPAGALCDRVSKRNVIVAMKGLEFLIMAGAALVLVTAPGDPIWLLALLGLMGVQSSLFSPAKYGILPEIVPHGRLSAANGQIELWTFAAIVLGTALGPMLLTAAPSPWMAAGGLALLSLVGIGFARGIETVPPARDEGGLATSVLGAWRALRSRRSLTLAVVGATWFWTVASLMGQNLIVYSKRVLELDEQWTGVPLGLFGVGVGIGSVLAGRLSGHRVEVGLIPFGAIVLAVLTLLLGAIAPGLAMTLVLMLLLGIGSGFIVVPINAVLQWRAPSEHRGGVIALANVFVFAGMMIGSVFGGQLAQIGLTTPSIFVIAGLMTLAGTAYALWLLPEAFLRLVIVILTRTLYRVSVLGSRVVPTEGGVLLTPNHVSFADGLFLIASIDRPIRFLVDEGQFNQPLVKPFLKLLRAIPISSDGGPRVILRAFRDAGRYLDDGKVVCIFPEGQITRTGTMQPFRRGMERIVKGREIPVIPVHLDRVWGSIFSYAGGRFGLKLPEELPYHVTVSFGDPLPSTSSLSDVRRAVTELGERAWFERKSDRSPLHRTFISSVRRRPWRRAVADPERPGVSRLGLLAGAVALARALRDEWRQEERIGVLLPPSVPGAMANVAACLAGRTVVNLNYTAGEAGMESVARQSGLPRVLTSRRFLDKAGIELPPSIEPLWLEDVAAGIGHGQRVVAALLALLAPTRWLERACGTQQPASMDSVATVIFSSGSTGEPKGVMLSHFNIDSNVEAVAQVFRLTPSDRILGILPLFHSFGNLLLWFALNRGAPINFHANPLDAPAIGKIVQDEEITLLLATPTFLQMYIRRCTPEQFGSLRLVMVGAEKLTDRVANAFEDRFGIRPLEGYGATECSPVVAASVPPFRAPGFFQAGSRRGFVGPPLPGVALRVVDPDTFEPLPVDTPGMLLARGPNVMLGYLGREDLTREVLRDGWYVTGDIALVDDDGFLKITDRLSRFSKIGGEMVPHGSVETALHDANGGAPGVQVFAVTGVPDERKGERLVVLTTVEIDDVAGLLDRLAQAGLPNLFIPRKDSFVKVDAIPLLGTGKVDLREVKRLAAEAMGIGS